MILISFSHRLSPTNIIGLESIYTYWLQANITLYTLRDKYTLGDYIPITITETKRDKRDKKLRAEKSSLRATPNKNTGISTSKPKKEKKEEKKVEKQPIPITKLRVIYGILCAEAYPEAEDEEKERKALIKAIKKALK